jgi:hypothetical protein
MIDLDEMLEVANKIRGNNKQTGIHYLLGYCWALLSDEQKQHHSDKFLAELGESNGDR